MSFGRQTLGRVGSHLAVLQFNFQRFMTHANTPPLNPPGASPAMPGNGVRGRKSAGFSLRCEKISPAFPVT